MARWVQVSEGCHVDLQLKEQRDGVRSFSFQALHERNKKL